MDKWQKELLEALAECGVSMGALMAVGSVIKTKASVGLMTRRLMEEVDNNGKEITDSLVLQILTDLMKEATAKEE